MKIAEFLPSRWKLYRFGDVAQFNRALFQVEPTESYHELSLRLYGNGFELRREVAGASLVAEEMQRLEVGQLVTSIHQFRNGALGIVPPEFEGAVLSKNFLVYDLDQTVVDASFLVRFLTAPSSVSFFQANSTGSATPIFPKVMIENVEVPLPPLAEQRRVVARVEELAAQIHEARTLRHQAAEEAEALSRADVETAFQKLRGKFGTEALENVCNTITDGDHNTPQFSEDGVRFIFVGNVSSGQLHFENSKRVSPDYFNTLKPHRLPNRGDILYSAVGATLGIPAVVDSDEPFCFQRHVAILKLNRKRVDTRFVWHMLSSRTVFEKAWASSTGSAQPTIPLRAIRELPIPVPAVLEQRRIVADLDALQAEVDALKRLQSETTAELDALLPSILDKAFKGEL
jgi:type I restriction enzyme S subunit